MFLIVTVQISMECETQESEGGYHSLQRGQKPQICLQPPPTPPPLPIIIGYPPILKILLTTLRPLRLTSRYLSLSMIVSKCITSIRIRPCYDHLMKAIEEWWFSTRDPWIGYPAP